MHPLRHKRSGKRLATALFAPSVHSIMSRSIWILVPALFAAPLVSAEIFKCVAKNGGDLYQNFPCQIDSLGSLPSGPAAATATSTPGDASQPKPKAAPVNVAATAKSAHASEPRAGMTPGEVRAIWGEPVETIQDEPITGRIEIWRYGDNRSVQFNHKHRVSAVQR